MIVKTELYGGSIGQVDDSAAVKRPTVIHAHDRVFAVIQIGDSDVGRQRQVRMRSAELIDVEGFTVGRTTAMKLGPVP